MYDSGNRSASAVIDIGHGTCDSACCRSSRNEAYAEIWYEICKYDGNLDRSGLRELSEGCKGCFEEVYEDWLRFERFDSEGVRVKGI